MRATSRAEKTSYPSHSFFQLGEPSRFERVDACEHHTFEGFEGLERRHWRVRVMESVAQEGLIKVAISSKIGDKGEDPLTVLNFLHPARDPTHHSLPKDARGRDRVRGDRYFLW